jgi:V/A-type H+-transporting ATPase subunit E
LSKIKDGLVAIANEVLEDVQKEAEAIILDSERKAKEILTRAKEEAEKVYSEIVNEAKQKVEVEKRKIGSLAELEMKHRILQEKEEMVETVFQKTLARLNEYVKTPEYNNYLLEIIQESAKKVGSKSLIVYVNAKDKAWLSQGNLNRLSTKLRLNLNLADKTEECMGGCKVQSLDGKMTYDNTLENRLELLRPALRHEVAGILFGRGR